MSPPVRRDPPEPPNMPPWKTPTSFCAACIACVASSCARCAAAAPVRDRSAAAGGPARGCAGLGEAGTGLGADRTSARGDEVLRRGDLALRLCDESAELRRRARGALLLVADAGEDRVDLCVGAVQALAGEEGRLAGPETSGRAASTWARVAAITEPGGRPDRAGPSPRRCRSRGRR
jgi:hypothetical protein